MLQIHMIQMGPFKDRPSEIHVWGFDAFQICAAKIVLLELTAGQVCPSQVCLTQNGLSDICLCQGGVFENCLIHHHLLTFDTV